MTDGVLLRECLSNGLSSYSVLILDEAHERSLDTDILMGLVKQHLATHPSFRLIVTSATIDVMQFSAYFHSAPVITITGRQHSVEVLHSACKSDRRVEYVVNAAVRIHLHEGPGDVLAFLTGSDECEKAKTLCFQALQRLETQGKAVASMVILALYGAMASEEQAKVFQPTPEDCRKVIFSTNISETSITVDGIGFVIDCGYVKQKQFNPMNMIDSLTVVPISKQQAKQRAGRAGRTQDGKCFRLYSESFFNEQMKETITAEIHRSNLASVVLILKILGISRPSCFDFIEKPADELMVQAYKHLFYIGAINENGEVTQLGREISRFPLDPAYGRCIISSLLCHCSSEMLTVLST
jgi:ATP-dependent RNA helicase DHX8/PRP22